MLTKKQWLEQYKGKLSQREITLLEAAYDVLTRNTMCSPHAPWGNTPVISPWSGDNAGIWNWDSAFHALTVSRYNDVLAKSCIDSFVKYQLPNGMLPDVILANGTVMDNCGKPPVMPWAVLTVFERSRDLDFLHRHYEAMIANARFWETQRCDGGLFYYSAQNDIYDKNSLYPKFESGWDNSPRWDGGIVNLWPVDLNCYMVLFYRCMAKMSCYLGESPKSWMEREADLSNRIERVLFDEKKQAYADRDRVNGTFVDVLSPASFMPLFVGIASQERGAKMDALARDSQKFYPGMPTVTYDCPAYNQDYWRGQTWLNVAYFAIKGLHDYGFLQTAKEIRTYLLDMIYDELPRGMFENYDSVHRRGAFNPCFSWTAAFVIEMILTNWNS